MEDVVSMNKISMNKIMVTNWLKVTKKLLLPILGKDIVDFIEKGLIVNYKIASYIKSKAKIRKLLLPRIDFIKPFWSDEEIKIGLGEIKIDEKTSLTRFSDKFSKVIGLSHRLIVPTSSGRTAIELSLKVLKSKYPNRKKVILPSYGCKGTFDPVVKNNLIPLFVDITYDLVPDSNKMIELFSDEVLACLIVNLTGKKMDTLRVIKEAKKYDIATIEDNCQNTSHQVPLMINALESDILIYSFGMGKNIIASGGGALATNIFKNEFEYESKHLKNQEMKEPYCRFEYFYSHYYNKNHKTATYHIDKLKESIYGYNYMSPLDAEILLIQIDKMDTIIKLRQKNAKVIINTLLLYPDLFYLQSFGNHIYTKLSVRFPNKKITNDFFNFMHDYSIELENMYIPLHLRNLGHLIEYKSLSNTENIAPLVLNIPVRPNLTDKELKRITKAIVKFGEKYGIN